MLNWIFYSQFTHNFWGLSCQFFKTHFSKWTHFLPFVQLSLDFCDFSIGFCDKFCVFGLFGYQLSIKLSKEKKSISLNQRMQIFQ